MEKCWVVEVTASTYGYIHLYIYIYTQKTSKLKTCSAVADSLTNKVLGLGSQEAQQRRSPLQRQIQLQQSLQSLSSTGEGIAEHQGRFAKVHEQHELREAGVAKCHLTPHLEMLPHLVCKAAKPQLLQKHQISAPRMVNPESNKKNIRNPHLDYANGPMLSTRNNSQFPMLGICVTQLLAASS